jgi:hypothetical protein
MRKCEAALANQCNDHGARKRARIACDGCRRRKMRCDGHEPCAKCLSADSTCQYSMPTGSSAVDEAQDRNEAGFAPGFDASLMAPAINNVDVAGNLAPQTSNTHLAITSTGSSNSESASLISVNHNDVGSHLSEHSRAAPSFDNMICEIPAMSASTEDNFFDMFNAEDVDEAWQMTPMVQSQHMMLRAILTPAGCVLRFQRFRLRLE